MVGEGSGGGRMEDKEGRKVTAIYYMETFYIISGLKYKKKKRKKKGKLQIDITKSSQAVMTKTITINNSSKSDGDRCVRKSKNDKRL